MNIPGVKAHQAWRVGLPGNLLSTAGGQQGQRPDDQRRAGLRGTLPTRNRTTGGDMLSPAPGHGRPVPSSVQDCPPQPCDDALPHFTGGGLRLTGGHRLGRGEIRPKPKLAWLQRLRSHLGHSSEIPGGWGVGGGHGGWEMQTPADPARLHGSSGVCFLPPILCRTIRPAVPHSQKTRILTAESLSPNPSQPLKTASQGRVLIPPLR